MNREAREAAVDWFAAEMKEKLNEPRNVAKGSWRNESYLGLLGRLKDELHELETELINPQSSYRSVIDEAVDVANFAMMLAEKACLESRPALLHDALGITPEHARKMREEHGDGPDAAREAVTDDDIKLATLLCAIDRLPRMPERFCFVIEVPSGDLFAVLEAAAAMYPKESTPKET